MSRSIGTPSSTWRIGIAVWRANSSSVRLLKSGERCWTTTKASPVFAGICENNRSSASSPPADAPTPTTYAGRRSAAIAGDSRLVVSSAAKLAGRSVMPPDSVRTQANPATRVPFSPAFLPHRAVQPFIVSDALAKLRIKGKYGSRNRERDRTWSLTSGPIEKWLHSAAAESAPRCGRRYEIATTDARRSSWSGGLLGHNLADSPTQH